MSSKSEKTKKSTTFKSADGHTTHECKVCHKRFRGTQKRGHPHTRCPEHRK